MNTRRILPVLTAALVLGLASSGSSPVAATAHGAPTSSSDHAEDKESGWLAYQSGRRVDRVFLIRPDGTQNHKIAPRLPGFVRHPDFSRDGRYLAFDQLSLGEAADQVYVADADGRDARLIAPCKLPACLTHWEPAWSPDGKHLVITTAGGPLTDTGPSTFGLAIIDVETQKLTQILTHAGTRGQDHFARWSPDGEHLVFWRERIRGGEPQAAIFTIGADGSHLRRLTPWSMNAGDPDWSPDDDLIVFGTRPLVAFGDGSSELYTMRPDGTGIQQLTDYGAKGPRATQPRWTPDGKAILYTRVGQSGLPRHIWQLSTDGGTDEPVLQRREIYTHPVLQPTPCRFE